MSEPPIAPVSLSLVAIAGFADAGPIGEALRCGGVAEFERSFGENGPLADAVRAFFAGGGAEALVVRVEADGDPLGALEGGAGVGVGVGVVHLARENDWPSVAQLGAAAVWCRERGALLVADAPREVETVDGVVAFAEELAAVAGEAAADVAVYFPHLRGSSTGGAVAAVIARTEPWQAPAGSEAVIADGASPTVALREDDIGRLTEAGVNALRTLPGTGTVVWGGRTLSRDVEWKYVNVRRYFAFLEHSIDAGTQWAVFEPNDEPLWAAIRNSISAFLHDQWRDGALLGSAADEAFFVRCDRTTMTAAEVAAGELRVIVGAATLRPAEFIVLALRRAVKPRPP